MSVFGFHALSSAWLLALVAPLVLFYFLKLRRPRQSVPSLFLWRQVLEDRRVNSPFQRFKRNLLLLLQLLLLLLVVLAAMQPFWQGRESRMERLPILIDCSASMAALDKPGGRSRLEEAKARVRKLIDEMLPDQELCLLSFSRTARRRTGFTSNKRELRQALDAIPIEDVPSDIEDALRMAQALARGASFDEVLLLSDGNFPHRADFDLPFKLDYQRLPAPGPNIGITAFNATRAPDGGWNVFLSIEGSPDAETSATVEVTQDGRAIADERVAVAEGRAERLTLTVGGGTPGLLRATLEPGGFDSLASDNTAHLELPAGRSLWVYAPPSLPSYRHALQAVPTVRLFAEAGSSASEPSYDLVITDRKDDLALEAPTRFCIGLVPDDLHTLMTIGREGTQVVDWRRNALILRHVELGDLVVIDQPRSNDDVRAFDYETRGYDILADGHLGPLLLKKRQGHRLDYWLLFHTDRSTLPYRIGFPILVSNLVQIAMNQTGLAEAKAIPTGVLPDVALAPSSAYRIRGPAGYEREEHSDDHGVVAGIPAPRVGLYRIAEGGDVKARVAASLLSPQETRLAAAEEIHFEEDLAVAASSAPLPTDRSLWWSLALLAFGVLLGEWWYFQRRPGGFAR